MATDDYTAESIRVLEDAEVIERFLYAQAEALAKQYSSPLPFVRRLLEACELSGYPVQDAVHRYLAGDASAPEPTDEFVEAFKQLADQR